MWSTGCRFNTYQHDFVSGPYGKYRLVYDLIPLESRVLELGCSGGYFSEHLLQTKRCWVTGFDNDREAIERCRAKGIQAFDLDLGSLLEADSLMAELGPFDRILAMDVLEHLVDPPNLLLRLHRHMHARSRLIVTGPNVAYWRTRWDLLCGRWKYDNAGIMDETHLRWYTRSSWRAMLQQAGFEVEIDRVAEALIPKEFLLRRVCKGLVVDLLKWPLQYLFPNLFAVVFLFTCRSRRPGCRPE